MDLTHIARILCSRDHTDNFVSEVCENLAGLPVPRHSPINTRCVQSDPINRCFAVLFKHRHKFSVIIYFIDASGDCIGSGIAGSARVRGLEANEAL